MSRARPVPPKTRIKKSGPLNYFPYKGGQLTAGGVPLARVAEETGTPVYVYSADAFLEPLKELQKGLAPVDHVVCYAVKANSNIAIIRLLSRAGAGVDLVSGGELFRAGLAGVPADRVVLSGVGKTPGEMMRALEYDGGGIFSFNVESTSELAVLNAVAQSVNKRARVALRFNPDVNPKTHPYISTGLKKNKFGMSRDEVLGVAQYLRELPGIDLRGISIHIGSQLLSLSPLGDAFGRLRSLIAELEPLLPAPLEFVDLGGGVGISYNGENPPPVRAYTDLILKHFGPRAGLPRSLKILIEPGRLLSGNSGALVTEVLYRKERPQKDFVIVDAAMNDLLRPALYGSYHEIVPLRSRASGSARSRNTDIVGPVCETGDCFASDRKLPVSIAQGDLLAILSAGAYGFTMSSNYNSRPRPAEVLAHKGRFRVIREREDYADLVRGERL
jgi:diaminopimelate decarboxylase